MIQSMVKRLFTAMGKFKALPICPYVFHLYITHDLIKPENKKVYMVKELMLKHNVELDEKELASVDDFERESLDIVEIVSCRRNKRSFPQLAASRC